MSNRPNTRKTRPTPPRPSTAKKQSSLSRGVLFGAVGAAVVLIAVIAIAVSVAGDEEVDAGPQTFPVEISGTALAELPRDGADPAVGATAPAVTGSTFDGRTVTIGDDGSPKVVMFLAHWCPHCRAEVPRITEWLADNGMPDGVDLYAVSTDVNADAPNYPPSRWLERENWPVTTIADDSQSSAAAAFGLSGFPFFVALDADGSVVVRTSGELTTQQFSALIDAAREG